jgi:hypothetical protein
VETILKLLQAYDSKLEIKTIVKGKSSVSFLFHPLGFNDLSNSCLFGFLDFENEDDIKQCLEEGLLWAKLKGSQSLVGPLDYSTYLNYRMRTDSFDRSAFYGEPLNSKKEYDFFLKQGFSDFVEYESTELQLKPELIEYFKPFQGLKLSLNSDQKWKILPLDKEFVKANSARFFQLSNAIFQDNFAFRNIPENIFLHHFISEIIPRICFKTSCLLLYENEWVGFCMNLQEQDIPDRLLVKTIGVKPAYRKMGFGFFLMIEYVFNQAMGNYSKGIFCLMKKENFPSFVSAKLVESKTRYVLLKKELDSLTI